MAANEHEYLGSAVDFLHRDWAAVVLAKRTILDASINPLIALLGCMSESRWDYLGGIPPDSPVDEIFI